MAAMLAGVPMIPYCRNRGSERLPTFQFPPSEALDGLINIAFPAAGMHATILPTKSCTKNGFTPMASALFSAFHRTQASAWTTPAKPMACLARRATARWHWRCGSAGKSAK